MTGRFLLSGPKPTAKRIEVDKDAEVCGKHELFDESLVVGDDGGIANIVIWVSTKNAAEKSWTEEQRQTKVVLETKNCRFQPHTLAMHAGQTLSIRNSDRAGHNTNVSFMANGSFCPIISPSDVSNIVVEQSEAVPVRVTCNIHPWMNGYLVVRPNSLFAVSGTDGKFEMKDVPARELEFQVWQEKSGFVPAVKLGDKPQKWVRGKFTYDVKPDQNDLGDIVVSAEVFNK